MAVRKTIKRTVTTHPAKSSPKKTSSKNTDSNTSSGKAASEKKPSGKTSAGKPRAKKNPAEKGPADELKLLLKELNSEEITWLLTQARTMIYNHKVEEVNKAALELAETKSKSPKKKSSGKKQAGASEVNIEPTGNGRSFVIIMGPKRLFVSLNELKDLVKLTQVTDDPADGSRRIFGWMDRERRDMVNDAAITGPGDPRLPKVFFILREKFTVG